MTLDINIGDGADALTINQLTDALNGTYWIDGWEASLGSDDYEVDIASGEGVFENSPIETDSTQTIDLEDDVDSNAPRKAVVYVTEDGQIDHSVGDPAASEPSDETRFRTWNPAPPARVDGVVVAEVWIATSSETNALVTDDVRSRRVSNSANNSVSLPAGLISMWSGTIAEIPSGWNLCDGSNNTPDLTDRFIVGAGNEYSVNDTGGEKEVQLTIEEMPSHSHSYDFPDSVGNGNGGATNDLQTGDTSSVGGDEAHENRPPYYALAYIMKTA